MAGETLEAKVVRFEGNEQRFNTLVNGGPDATWHSTGGTELPSVQKFFADTEALYDNAVLVASYAEMGSRLPTIPEGSVVEVQKDETVGDSRTRYKVQGGLAVFLVNVDRWVDVVKRAPLIYPDYAAASAAAATLPDGQEIEAPNADGRLSRFAVQSGALVFKDYAPDAIRMQSYAALRNYTGKTLAVDITTRLIAGRFNCLGVVPGAIDDNCTRVIDSLGRLWERSFAGPVYVSWAEGKFDGVVDDTEALRRAANAAYYYGVPLSYAGIRDIGVDANAQIRLRTSTDYGESVITCLNGFDPAITSYVSTRRVMFIVDDPTTPLDSINLSGTLDAGLFRKGSVDYFTNLEGGYVRARLPLFRVPWRFDDNTRDFEFTCEINKGKSNVPLFVDMTAYTTTVSAKFRKNPRTRIDLGTCKVNLNGANNQTIYRVERNGVDLGLTWDKEMLDQDSCCSLVEQADCADLNIRRLHGPGMDQRATGTPVATYVYLGNGGSRLRMDKTWCAKNWAHLGCSFVSDMEFRNCDVYRLDVHEHCYDLRAYNCRTLNPVQYGIGGGTWNLEGLEVVPTPGQGTPVFFRPRSDYGKVFYGSIYGKNWRMTVPDDTYISVLDFLDMGSAQIVAPMPENIVVDGVYVTLTPTTSGNPTRNFRIFDMTRVAGKQMQAPSLVRVTGVHLDAPRTVSGRIYINPASCERPTGLECTFDFDKITSTRDFNLTLQAPDLQVAQPEPTWADLRVANCGSTVALAVRLDDLVFRFVDVSNNNKVTTAQSTKWPRQFIIRESTLDFRNTAAGLKRLGGVSAYRSYTNILEDCVTYGAVDVSTMNAMKGVKARRYDEAGSVVQLTPVGMRDGATLANMLTGWIDPAVFY